ncbi:MAG: cytochrome C, partial [Aquificaceae bacterium]
EDAVYGFLSNYLTPQAHPAYMPYFVGKDEELRALSAYIADMISKGGSVSAKIEVPGVRAAQK